jgi:tRNA threonylcarbamoyladenosine biosynthesis protein TsaB
VRGVVRRFAPGPVTLNGSGAPAIAVEALTSGIDAVVPSGSGLPDIAWVARLGLVADPAQALPKPLYLRGPDAKPQDQAGLPRR